MYKITVPTIITNGHFNKEKTLFELKRCGADRIALAIDRELDYTFSSSNNLKLLKELVQYYRENGLEVLVWLGETFGHDSYYHVAPKYTNMRAFDYDGNIKNIASFCPFDENFTADFCNWIRDVAKCNPDMIMLDDDFRFSNRGGVFTACCCDKHLSHMSKQLGENVHVSDLKKLVFDGGNIRYRKAWLNSQKESIHQFCAALRQALDEVNPQIRLGFCACTGSYGLEGWDAFEVSRIMAGNTKPFLRTIASPYWASLGNNKLGEIIEVERSQLGKMPDGEVFVEGDTYPRPRSACPAAFLECYDMIIRADGRADGILKYMLDYVSDADYETGYVDAMINNEKLYKAVSELFDGAKCTGVKPYLSQNINEELSLTKRQSLFTREFNFIFENCLPSTYEDGFVNILFGEQARYISEDELKNGNIIDITAAKILMERGIDVGIREFLPNNEYGQRGFTDLPQEYFIDEDIYVRLWGGVTPCNVKVDSNARILTEYVYRQTYRQIGDFEYENANNMKFRVFTFDAGEAGQSRDWLSTYAKRRSVVNSIKWLGKPLDVTTVGNYPELYLITKEKDSSLRVGAWNLFADKIKQLRLDISRPFTKVRFINCTGHVEGSTIVLDSVLYPYEFAGFEIH